MLTDRDFTSNGLVIVGRVLAPKGLNGEIQVEVLSDSPERFSSGGVLYVRGQPHTIHHSSTMPRGRVAVRLEGIDSREQAEALRHDYLMVPEDSVPSLPEGEFYHYQIIGISVYTGEREHLGQISEIIETGSNDVYVVTLCGEELLIPALDEVIREVDVKAGTMTVDLPDGIR